MMSPTPDNESTSVSAGQSYLWIEVGCTGFAGWVRADGRSKKRALDSAALMTSISTTALHTTASNTRPALRTPYPVSESTEHTLYTNQTVE